MTKLEILRNIYTRGKCIEDVMSDGLGWDKMTTEEELYW